MIPAWLKNKYILTAGAFAVWMLFFDTRDVITTHFRQRGELNRLQESKAYYEKEIEKTRKELEQLRSDPRILEKYVPGKIPHEERQRRPVRYFSESNTIRSTSSRLFTWTDSGTDSFGFKWTKKDCT